MRVAAIDPGGFTGYCIIDAPVTLIESGQGSERAKILALCLSYEPDVVVVEDFKPQAGLPEWSPLPAPKVIGALEELCEREGVKLVTQVPAMKSRIDNTILQIANLWQRGRPHANDAIRHALYYLWFKQGYEHAEEVQRILKQRISLVKARREEFHTNESLAQSRRKLLRVALRKDFSEEGDSESSARRRTHDN